MIYNDAVNDDRESGRAYVPGNLIIVETPWGPTHFAYLTLILHFYILQT
jgi:hypothetical protein